ncbi:MAG TPA: S26 family signal peptidase [Acidimicrobiales bacterium]|nr:S26 family signal peptidase [Acidimicrobiales bacterium]
MTGAALRGLAVTGAGAGALGVGWALWRIVGVQRLVVVGDSMLPTLLPGDRLVALRARRLQPDDLVVTPDPRLEERTLVKRVRWTGQDVAGAPVVWVEGDNPVTSTDSRVLGPLPRARVGRRVVWRYAPAERAGRLGSRRRARR